MIIRKTAPSKRLLDVFPQYNKVFYGSTIAQRIGIKTMSNYSDGYYIVIMPLAGFGKADFITAYLADTLGSMGRQATIDLIRVLLL